MAEMADVWLSVAARAENVAVVRQALVGLCEALAVEGNVVADVKLAVTEACTNVVVHAYGDEPADTDAMEVEAGPNGTHLVVLVRDHGRGIVPRADSPGLGLGLPLIAAVADSVQIAGSAAEGRTEVLMTFPLNGSG